MAEFEQGARRRIVILTLLKELAAEPDAEKAHIEADLLLCEYLEISGAKDIVEAFKAIKKNLSQPFTNNEKAVFTTWACMHPRPDCTCYRCNDLRSDDYLAPVQSD